MNFKKTQRFALLMMSSLLLGSVPWGGAVAAPAADKNLSTLAIPASVTAAAGQNTNLQTASTSKKTTDSEDEQRVIVTFKDKKKVNAALIKGKVKRQQKHSKTISAKMTAKEIENLKKNTDIQSVEPDVQIQAAAQTVEWGVERVQAPVAWNQSYTGRGIKVAILDSGIDLHHEDLTVSGGASFVDYTSSYDDDSGHGTHVAGIVAAKNNETGVVGVAPDVSLYALKVLDATGKGYLSDVIAGIDWALDNDVNILNMSVTTPVDSPALHQALDQAYASGLLIVASAGNTGNALQYPALYSSVISVGAVDENGQRAAFSAAGSDLELVAPGVHIRSTYKDNSYMEMSGTSMAAPFVAGELALLKQQHPDWSNVELRHALDTSALDMGTVGKDAETGYGLVQTKLDSVQVPEETPEDGTDQTPAPVVTEDVYQDAFVYASALTPVVKHRINNSNGTIVDVTHYFPSLINARAITYDFGGSNGQGNSGYVLYADNTVKAKAYGSSTVTDVTARFPSLTNAVSIAVDTDGGGTFVLYADHTVKYRPFGTNSVVQDGTSWFPSLANARGISVDSGDFYVLNTNNTVAKKRNNVLSDDTYKFPDLTNARSISYDHMFNFFDSNGGYGGGFVGYMDLNPILTVNSTNQFAFRNSSSSAITLSGTVTDPDNDPVTIQATLAGITRTVTISNTISGQPWTLQWDAIADNIPVGAYSSINVTANESFTGSATATFAGTLTVENIPNVPTGLSPGSISSSTPTPVAGTTPVLGWTFSDPDPGDIQSAFDVQVYNAAGTTMVYDSGWRTSTVSSFTVPSGILSRGMTYGWKVAVKDMKGGAASAFSSLSYIKTQYVPMITTMSFTNGQTLTDNILTFTWNYLDPEGQPQTKYQIQGSRDNWVTIGYDSGVISSSAGTHTTTPISDGTWSFKLKVFDGLEWSLEAQRTGLIVPVMAEPNDTSAQAAPLNLGQTYTGLINPSTDVDFFKFTAIKSEIDRVTLTVPSGLNYDIYVYDGNMNLLAAGIKGSGLAENVLFETTVGSTYYVKIVGVDGSYSTTVNYSLKVSKVTSTQQTNYQYDNNGNIIGKTTVQTN